MDPSLPYQASRWLTSVLSTARPGASSLIPTRLGSIFDRPDGLGPNGPSAPAFARQPSNGHKWTVFFNKPAYWACVTLGLSSTRLQVRVLHGPLVDPRSRARRVAGSNSLTTHRSVSVRSLSRDFLSQHLRSPTNTQPVHFK